MANGQSWISSKKMQKTETARLAKEEDIGGPKLLEVLQWDRMGLGLYPP